MRRLIRLVALIAVLAAVLAAGLIGARLMPAAAETAEPETTMQAPPAWAQGWQVSAPRPGLDEIRPGGLVELGLRQRFAEPADQIEGNVIVTAPDGQTVGTSLSMTGDAWGFLIYPNDFVDGAATIAGQYVVIYQVNGATVATDEFAVGE